MKLIDLGPNMKKLLRLSLLLLIAACSAPPHTPPPIVSGISWELAEFRKEYLSDIAYDLFFQIPLEKSEPIPAEVSIHFTLNAHIQSLPIDFNQSPERIRSVSVNGAPQPINCEAEHILIEGRHLVKGENNIAISFLAGERSLNRSDDFLYSLLVPDRASTVFPCFDQPNLKSRFRLSLEIPESWEAIANGSLTLSQTENGRKTMHFGETERISTYLFAFAAGNFKKATADSPWGEMMMLHRESDSTKAALNTPEIFELHRRALQWMEEYTGIPYPYGKLDFALIPPFQYGGMEHVGAIQYRASSLMLEANANITSKLGRASLISHEVAHMWFGDLVTMNWFDDVWLKEVFANFMAAKMVNPSFPDINHELRFLLAHHPAAMSVDRTEGRHPIRQSLENLKQAGNLYGPIIYQKAPIMMRQLELQLGEKAFREALREYLQKFPHSNATWDDLVAILDSYSEADINEWSRLWVKEAIMPKIRFTVDGISLHYQHDNGDWLPQSFEIGYFDGKQWQAMAITIDAPQGAFELPIENPIIIPNWDGLGYGLMTTSEDFSLYIPDLDNPVARASAYLQVYEAMLHGLMPPTRLLSLVQSGLQKETEQQLIGRLLGMASSIYWRYTTDSDRMDLAKIWEPLILKKWMESSDPGLKRVWYGAYVDLGMTEDALRNMEKWWNSDAEIYGLKLNENDYTGLAAALALRSEKIGGWVLDAQDQKIKNADNLRRWQFVKPALSADAAVRKAFFTSLLEAENRRYEPWVTQALGYLNHPLRRQHALKFLPKALDELEEIQLTGDIFFPKAWLDAAFSGHQSKEAAALIRSFMKDNPGYNPRLIQKLQQAADPVLRAEALLYSTKPEK